MAREFFIDGSFWIALFYPGDEHHYESQVIWQEIRTSRWPIVTSNWTLYEALTHFNRRTLRRHDLSLRALDVVANTSTIVRVESAGSENRSLDIFRRHADKQWSVVDCANFACIGQRQSELALSYDGNFDQGQAEFGFRLLRPQV